MVAPPHFIINIQVWSSVNSSASLPKISGKSLWLQKQSGNICIYVIKLLDALLTWMANSTDAGQIVKGECYFFYNKTEYLQTPIKSS